MKNFILSTLCLLFISSAWSQSSGRIEGNIKGVDAIALEGASLSLLRAADSSIAKLELSNKQGFFSFNDIDYGKYVIAVTAVGHQKTFSKTFILDSLHALVKMPDISLAPITRDLKGVTVTARKPLIEHKIDRTIVNVDALVMNTGTSALEVLESAPGVTVDREGRISLKGKEGVQVFIDGRPSQLSGEDLVTMLRNMNSSQMDQVEIMTNPPARYDAAGTAGIINIKTKKSVTVGYNGTASISYMQGRYPKSSESLMFNYRKSKVNLFTNLSHNYRSGFGELRIQRSILNTNTSTLENYFEQESYMFREGNSFSGRLGLDYFANKNTTFGIMVDGSGSTSLSDNRNVTNILDPSRIPEAITKASVVNNSNQKSFRTNLNMRTILDSNKRELSADLDFISFRTDNDQFMINSYYDPEGLTLDKADSLQGMLPQAIKVYGARVDYLHPLKKGSKFEAGLKASLVRTDNNASYDSIQYGNLIHDIYRSNHFVYEENVNAAYANFSAPLSKKLSMQLGLRLENTNANGLQLTTGEEFTRHYTQLFPTAYLQYKINEKNSLLLNYGRRIHRPNYQSLNPFIRFIDRYTFSKGNPNLKPQLGNNFELTYSWRNWITTTLNYSYITDLFESVIEQKGEEAYSTPANIASLQQYGVTVSSNIPITKWWTSNVNFNVFNNNYQGVVSNTEIDLGATSFILSGIQQFKVNKTLTAELIGRFRNGWYEGVIKARPVGFVGIGFSQQMFKNKASLRLAVRDMFYTQKFRGASKYGNVDFKLQQAQDSQVVTIGFTYRFNKGKKIGPTKRTQGSANEEQSRIGED